MARYALEFVGGRADPAAGKTGQFLPGYPADDLIVNSKKEADLLVKSGLYRMSGTADAEVSEAE